MRQSSTGILHFLRQHHVAWYFTALLTWGGLIGSLPGYYLWFIEQPIRMQFNTGQIALVLASGFASMFCAVVSLSLGTFLFIRLPGNRGALFVSYFLLMYGLLMAGPLEFGEYLIFRELGVWSFRIQAIFFTAPVFLLLLTFPNGTITPPGFRWLFPFLLLIMLGFAVLPLTEINSIDTLRSKLLGVLTMGLLALAFGAQVYRYLRISSPSERQQTKIVLFGISVQALFFAISTSAWLRLPPGTQGTLSIEPPELLVSTLFWWIGMALLPVSFTLAVVRSHLWDIDVIIRRTLVYGILTVTLGLLYLSMVILAQQFARIVIGHDTPVAVVLSTLVSASLFNPLRGRIQSMIDRRFYRSKYNADLALASFQQSMRNRVDLDQVEKDLSGIVQETVQPEWIRVWIRKSTQEKH